MLFNSSSVRPDGNNIHVFLFELTVHVYSVDICPQQLFEYKIDIAEGISLEYMI